MSNGEFLKRILLSAMNVESKMLMLKYYPIMETNEDKLLEKLVSHYGRSRLQSKQFHKMEILKIKYDCLSC